MQETQPDRTPRWRECSKKAARAAQAYIAATWRGLSPESRKKSKQAMAAFIISVILAVLVAGEGFSYAQYCTLFLLFFAIQLWITEAAPPFAVGIFIVGFLVYALGNADGIDVGKYVKTWSDGIIILFLGGFFLAEGMQKTRLDYKLLQKLLPYFGQQARYILLGLMLTTACISMLMSNTATTAMMIATAAPLYTNSKSNFSRALLLGIPAAASIGGMGTIAPTFDGAMWNTKGWEIGGQYTIRKNIVGSLIYFQGNEIFSAEPEGKTGIKKGFGRVEFFF